MTEPRYALEDFNDIAGRDPAADDEHVDSWAPILLTGLPDKPPVQPTLGGVGLVYPGKRHVFSGPQESAKTLAAYAIGIQVVREGGTTLIIDFEMGAWDARNRLLELGATHDELQRIPYVEPHDPATDDRIGRLAALNPSLVIIDAAAGAYDLQGLDDNKRGDVERIARLYIRRFWKNGVATIMLDHVVKNTEGRGKYAIGSERKIGGADVHLGFETITPISRGSTGLYKVVTHKDRGGYLQRGKLADLHLHSDPETHRITWEFTPAEHIEPGQEFIPTKQMQKASEILLRRPDPLTKNELVQELGGNREVALKAVGKLIELGYVTVTVGPRNSHNLTSTRPFTVREWENQGTDTTSSDRFSTSSRTSPLTGSRTAPPYGERNQSDGTGNGRPVPNDEHDHRPLSWIDELTHREDPPGDLHDPPATNDDLPI